MTGSWVQICTAAARISDVSGKSVSVADVHRLGGDEGPLTVEWLHDHFGVLESSLAAYLNDLAAHGGDNQTAGPTVGRWSRADDPDSFADRGDYDDTPNDTPEDPR